MVPQSELWLSVIGTLKGRVDFVDIFPREGIVTTEIDTQRQTNPWKLIDQTAQENRYLQLSFDKYTDTPLPHSMTHAHLHSTHINMHTHYTHKG